MNIIYLQLGTNLGEREKNLKKVISLIERYISKISQKSKVYLCSPWGRANQDDFLNQVICLESKFSAEKILKIIHLIENEMGRTRAEKWGERIIDIDILFFNNEIINQGNLIIPHPYLHERLFVIIPLMEISPNFIHPIFKKDITSLFETCKDQEKVTEYAI